MKGHKAISLLNKKMNKQELKDKIKCLDEQIEDANRNVKICGKLLGQKIIVQEALQECRDRTKTQLAEL